MFCSGCDYAGCLRCGLRACPSGVSKRSGLPGVCYLPPRPKQIQHKLQTTGGNMHYYCQEADAEMCTRVGSDHHMRILQGAPNIAISILSYVFEFSFSVAVERNCCFLNCWVEPEHHHQPYWFQLGACLQWVYILLSSINSCSFVSIHFYNRD